MVTGPTKPFGSALMDHARNPQFFDLLVGSYRRLAGAEPPFLPPGVPRDADWLYAQARSCVLAHNTDPDPRFIYANKAAQSLFEYSWDEFMTLPSRLSAEAPRREERQRLLDTVARDGFTAGYTGIRIAKSGRRFRIEDGVLWQLREPDGALRGVAATFATWQDL
jgi:PAS domain-containing protein